MEKNVIVTDEFGRKISSTYPKRAKGLIKTGRAELVSESEIRLIGFCPPYDLEDSFFMSENIINENEVKPEEQKPKHKLYFNSREWRFNPACGSNVGERTMITDMNGKISEAWCIGNWKKELTEIQTENLSLPKNTDFTFTFWLNGGENDRLEEICRLQIIFDDDAENRYTYKLNRDTIKPVKNYKGWVLFEIPFTTGNNTYTRLRFSVQDAHTAILPALDKESYDLLPNEVPNPRIPQRHNIIFEEGFPRDSSWSYLVFGDKITQKAKTAFSSFSGTAGEYAEKTGRFAGETAEKAGKIAGDLANEAMTFAKKAAEFASEKVKDLKHSAVNSDFARTHFHGDIDFDEMTDETAEENYCDAEDDGSDEAHDERLRSEIEHLKKLQEEISAKIDNLLGS